MQNLPKIVLDIIILAGGRGTRMTSSLPKVLHLIAHQTLIEYVLKLMTEIRSIKNISIDGQEYSITIQNSIVVISEELQSNAQFNELKTKYSFETVTQYKRLGTGDATRIAIEYIQNKNEQPVYNEGIDINKIDTGQKKAVLILYGDSPFITVETIKKLIQTKFTNIVDENSILIKTEEPSLVCVGFSANNNNYDCCNYGYGRFLISDMDRKCIVSIVEAAKDVGGIYDYTNDTVNTASIYNGGTLIADYNIVVDFIKSAKQRTGSAYTAKTSEFYLTHIVNYAVERNRICSYIEIDQQEASGVNDVKQKAQAEKIMQSRLRMKMQSNGVTLIDPETVFFSSDTQISEGTIVDPYVFFGKNVTIGRNCHILSFSHIEGAKINDSVKIGPFARIRPDTEIANYCKIGNFVEVKNSKLRNNVISGHLSYIGDATLGEYVNVGAGAIFCNFDGKDKHHSKIGAHTFIGSNVSIISPIAVGDNSFIGAGSVITNNIPDKTLAVSRSKQANIEGWERVKNKKEQGDGIVGKIKPKNNL